MSKKNIVLLIAGILILLGGAMFAFGYFYSGGGGVYIDSQGIHTINTKDEAKMVSTIVDKFTAVDCDVSMHNVKLVKSNEYKVEYKNMYNKQLTVSVENNVLKIKSRHVFTLWFFSWIGGNNDITIYYPESTEFTYVNVQSTSGYVEAQDGLKISGNSLFKSTSGDVKISNVNADSITLQSTSGTHYINNVNSNKELTATSTSGSCIIKNANADSIVSSSTSGEVKTENIFCKNIDIASTSGSTYINGKVTEKFSAKTTSGEVQISGSISGNGYAKSTSGSVYIDIAAPESQYSYNLKSTSGKCRVNGGEAYSRVNSGAIYTIEGKTTSGSISLNFAG